MGYSELKPYLPQEQTLRQQLYNSLQGDVVLTLMKTLAFDKYTKNDAHEYFEENRAMKVEKDTFKNWSNEYASLYDTFMEVKNRLGFQKEIELYLTISYDVNATAVSTRRDDETCIVNLNSPLLIGLTREELKFIIGHEIGHLLNGENKLEQIMRFVYPQGPSGLFMQKWLLWNRLSELIADQYGYLASGDLETCVSAMSKVTNGLKGFKEQGKTLEQFIEQTDKEIDELRQDCCPQHTTHPLNAIRIKAIYLFAKREQIGNEQFEKEMDDLLKLQYKLRESELDTLKTIFFAIAGYKTALADKKVSTSEIECILNEISQYQMFPREYLDNLLAQDELDKMLDDSIKRILEIDRDVAEELLTFLGRIAIADHHIHPAEMEYITYIGLNKLQQTHRSIAKVMASVIAHYYVPSIMD